MTQHVAIFFTLLYYPFLMSVRLLLQIMKKRNEAATMRSPLKFSIVFTTFLTLSACEHPSKGKLTFSPPPTGPNFNSNHLPPLPSLSDPQTPLLTKTELLSNFRPGDTRSRFHMDQNKQI